MEYSRVGVPLKTGRSFVSPSYSRGGRREEREGGDMSNKVFLLLGKPSFKKKRNFMKLFQKRGGRSTGFHISYSEMLLPLKKREKIKIGIS